MNDPVVISGRSLTTALGGSVDEIWGALLAGRCGIGTITGFDASGFPCQSAAQVTGVDEESLDLPRRESRIMDLHSFILLKSASEAMLEAGLGEVDETAADTGFFAAIGLVDYKPEELIGALTAARDEQGGIDYDRFYESGYREIFPLWPLSMLNNIALCQVAVRLGLRGENTVYSPHADSALQALAEAAATVAEGRNRAVLAGAVGEKVSEMSLARGLLHGMINRQGQVPPCRPFTADGAGSVLGEGGGAVLLEPCSRAVSRGLKPLVSIRGYGASFGLGAPNEAGAGPSSDAITRAMSDAIQRSDRRPEQVDLVIAHGDGTRGGDQREIEAIRQLFPESGCSTRLYSSKGSLGNLLAGAPMVDLILAERIISSGMIPATLGSGEVLAPAAAMLVREPLEARPRVILINAFSYEGQASSLLVERMDH